MIWNTHTFKRMNHTNKQIFLFGIWKEFYVTFATMMTNHCKTGYFIRSVIVCIDINKSPIHLIAFTSIAGISASAISLRCNCLPFRWNKIFMLTDVSFYSSQASCISLFLDSFQDNFGIRYILFQQIIYDSPISRDNCRSCFSPSKGVWNNKESVCFYSTELSSCQTGTASHFSKVDFVWIKLIPLLRLHFFYDLCYDSLQVITIIFVHVSPFMVHWLTPL